MRSTCFWLSFVAVAATTVVSCTYDFEAPFRESPTETTTDSGTAGGTTTTTSNTGGAAASGGSGATAGSGGEATGGQGTGAQAGGENCSNGIDDDGDQAADCADTECQVDWECAVAAPAGWLGPAAFYLGDADQVPDCGAPWNDHTDGGVGLDAPAAQCTACGCDDPVFQCDNPTLVPYNSSSCSSPYASLDALTAGVCYTDSVNINTDSYGADPGAVQNASCATTGGDASIPPTSWQQSARFCTGELRQVGCSGGNLCAPRTTASLRRCIYRADAYPTCPAPYTDELAVYTSIDDTRRCDACGCSPPVVDCAGSFDIFDTSACGGIPEASVDSGDCTFSQAYPGMSYRLTATSFTAQPCAATGGTALGTATPEGLVTVCCLP